MQKQGSGRRQTLLSFRIGELAAGWYQDHLKVVLRSENKSQTLSQEACKVGSGPTETKEIRVRKVPGREI